MKQYKAWELLPEEKVYLKYEADKVIAELKAQKAQAEDNCAYWKMSEGNAVNAMHETEEACMFLTKSEHHQKYKQCLAMAKWCESEANYWYDTTLVQQRWHYGFYVSWCEKWLKLADQFSDKEA